MADSTQTTADKGALVRFFGAVERMGQRLPDPLTLFFGMGHSSSSSRRSSSVPRQRLCSEAVIPCSSK